MGNPAKPISKEMIINGLQYAKSIRSLARYLGCSYVHLKKYMKLYTDENGITFQEKYKNQFGVGIGKMRADTHSEDKVARILAGKGGWENTKTSVLIQQFIKYGYMPECCNKCGFSERRLIDYKVPLLLNFKDKDKNNYKLDNIELVCYNCYFLYIGEVFTNYQKRAIETKQETHDNPTFDLDEEYWEKMKLDIQKESEKLSSYGSEFISRL